MKKKSKKASMLKDKVTPLRLVENTSCADTLLTLEHLTDLARKGECQGIAFGAILRGGRSARGYVGAAIEQPSLAVGTLSQVIFDIQLES
ncbi:MAG: hypothetical protein ACU4EQ_07470 [Candidatus Nitrosoglobus sp.]|jgi:hypothetical protein